MLILLFTKCFSRTNILYKVKIPIRGYGNKKCQCKLTQLIKQILTLPYRDSYIVYC